MGIYDRDYARDQYAGQSGSTVRLVLPPLTPVVKWLLIINVGVFVASYVIQPLGNFLFTWFSVFPVNIGVALQVWRLITYQFLHGGVGHIFFNMLILFFFGSMLERHWGSNKFLTFYLICGAMGGVLDTLLVMGGALAPIPLVGASGAIYGMLAAGAILFPNLLVYVMFVFPIPLKILAPILALISFLGVIGGPNAGGQAAHLAGMAAGAVYVLWPRWKQHIADRPRRPIKWESEINRRRIFQAEVDRILDKVHKSGIASLTRKEKKTLQQASRQHQQTRL
jgi:membrane associated rhomboid family serine protease